MLKEGEAAIPANTENWRNPDNIIINKNKRFLYTIFFIRK
jgi:hypothetical protein